LVGRFLSCNRCSFSQGLGRTPSVHGRSFFLAFVFVFSVCHLGVLQALGSQSFSSSILSPSNYIPRLLSSFGLLSSLAVINLHPRTSLRRHNPFQARWFTSLSYLSFICLFLFSSSRISRPFLRSSSSHPFLPARSFHSCLYSAFAVSIPSVHSVSASPSALSACCRTPSFV